MPIVGVALEVWTVNAEMGIDNIVISHDVEAALTYAKETWSKRAEVEEYVLARMRKLERLRGRKEPDGTWATYFDILYFDAMEFFVTYPIQVLVCATALTTIVGYVFLYFCGGRMKKRIADVKELLQAADEGRVTPVIDGEATVLPISPPPVGAITATSGEGEGEGDSPAAVPGADGVQGQHGTGEVEVEEEEVPVTHECFHDVGTADAEDDEDDVSRDASSSAALRRRRRTPKADT